MQRSLKSLVIVLLVASTAIAPALAGTDTATTEAQEIQQVQEAQEAQEVQQGQQVQQSNLDEVEESRSGALLLGGSVEENDCVVLLTLYFTGDPSMQGVTLFSILQSCG